MLKLITYTILGAARQVTGSMHLWNINGFKFLLESGQFQGSDSFELKYNRKLYFDPKSIDAIILTHAHIDHCGRLPYLVSNGFRGKIYATSATKDLTEIILKDAEEIEYMKQRENPNYEPIVTHESVSKVLNLIKPIKYNKTVNLDANIKFKFIDAGHILGSAQVIFTVEEKNKEIKIGFTGDLGRKKLPFLRDPEYIKKGVDILITEGTYGDSVHAPIEKTVDELKRYIESVYRHQSKLLIPAFSVGRTQTLIYFLNELVEHRQIPLLPVYIDSPMSVDVTDLFRAHKECYDQETWDLINSGDNPLEFRGLHYIVREDESYDILHKRGAAIIIASSGMCNGGRVLRHLKFVLKDPFSIVLFTSYQAKGTLGRALLEGKNKVTLFDRKIRVKAKIHQLKGLSAHTDKAELIEYIQQMKNKPKHVILVHGEKNKLKALEKEIKKKKLTNKTYIPKFKSTTTFT